MQGSVKIEGRPHLTPLERVLLIINVLGSFEESTSRIVNVQSEELSVEQAQRDVYESHRHRVFSLAFYMTGNELEAEKLLTECFIRAFQTNPQPDSTVIDDALVAGLREQFLLAPAASMPVSALAGMNNRNVRRTDLEEAIQELPPFERLTFLLRDVEGYSAEAVSQLVNVPQPEIARTLFSARVRLRGVLAARGSSRAA